MSQATNASTMTRAPAATPAAPSPQRHRQRRTYSTAGLIRAGMATPQPPSGIQFNFHNLLDNLREEGPCHLIVGVTAYNANTNIPDETPFLDNAMHDIVGALRKKADVIAIDGAA